MPATSRRTGYWYGGQYFRSKQQVVARLMLMLHTYDPGEQVPLRDEAILLDVLRQHPSAEEKIGNGIAYFTVETNPQFPSTKSFWIHRMDGTGTDFSYHKCLRPASKWEEFTQACRCAVMEEIIAFKLFTFGGRFRVACPVTGNMCAFDEMHVDHKPPRTFSRLVRDFLLQQGLDFEDIELVSHDGLAGRVFADETLAAVWRNYHRVFADLWVISKEAHVQLTRTRLLEKDSF